MGARRGRESLVNSERPLSGRVGGMLLDEPLDHAQHALQSLGLVVGEIGDQRHARAIPVEHLRVIDDGLLRAVIQDLLVARDCLPLGVALEGAGGGWAQAAVGGLGAAGLLRAERVLALVPAGFRRERRATPIALKRFQCARGPPTGAQAKLQAALNGRRFRPDGDGSRIGASPPFASRIAQGRLDGAADEGDRRGESAEVAWRFAGI